MKKNVLLIINQLHGGGAQKVIANLSRYLSAQYTVTFIVYNDLDKIVFEYGGELIRVSLPHASDTHNNSFVKRAVRFFALVRKIRQIKKEKKIDVSISFMEASNIVNILSRRKEKTVLSVRSFLSHEFNDHPRLKVFRHFIRLLYNRADHIVVPSILLKHDLVTNFRVKQNRIDLIYNFTDSELIEKLRQENMPPHLQKLFANHHIIINVGRITNAKGQWLLVPVLARVKQQLPGAKLVILGEGPVEQKIMALASQENLRVYRETISEKEDLENRYDIYLLGFVKNPFPYLDRSRLFIKSSIYEGFPNVIIEAMACGLPIISSDCASGPREILQPGSDFLKQTKAIEYAEYGLLTPVAAEAAAEEKYAEITAAAIIEMMTDPAKNEYYSAQSKKRAKDFEKEKILSEWIQIIEK